MRLPPEYVAAIKKSAAEAFGPSTVVRLFGSRVRDDLRGGDIDLHVEVGELADEWGQRGRFEHALFQAIEPQKVDLVISRRGIEPHGIERIAYRDGVIL